MEEKDETLERNHKTIKEMMKQRLESSTHDDKLRASYIPIYFC